MGGTIAIGERLALVREGLERAALESGLTVIASCRDYGSLRQVVVARRPDLVVLDSVLLGPTPELRLRLLQVSLGSHRVVLLADRSELARFSPADIRAVVPRDADALMIRDALETVHAGGTWRAPAVPTAAAADRASRLTPREADVLSLIAAGRSTAGVAAELYLSPTTVKTHLRSAHGKLGVSTRAAAVAEAMRRGVVH